MAHIGRGAVAVVGQSLDHDGDAAGAVTLIGDCLILGLVAALGALDNALDVIVGHAVGLALAIRAASLELEAGLPPPSLTATAISRPILVKTLARARRSFPFYA